jgi:nucleotide-binding universal stress UspA family protein
MTRVVAWIVEGTWPSCVDAVRAHAPDGAGIVLLHVPDPEVAAAAHAAYAGLLGRGGRPGRDPGTELEHEAAAYGEQLLRAAAARLGLPCEARQRTGRVEREVVAEAEGADLLVLARDGDHSRLGPHSLGPHSRFVVDHAPCPVLLVWPDTPPGTDTIPPPPRHPPLARPGHHHPGRPDAHDRPGPPHPPPPAAPPPPPPDEARPPDGPDDGHAGPGGRG